MHLTTKGRYAVTAMLDIALAGGTVALTDIAERQSISKTYLEQLFVKLRGAGLVESIRGPSGGYRLTRLPQDISIEQIIKAIHEKVDATRCGGTKDCQSGKPCLTHKLWANLNNVISDYLQSITLAQLINEKEAHSMVILKQYKDKTVMVK